MDYKELVEALKEMLPEKIPYGELVGAPWPYTGQGEMVYEDPEPYFIEQAATAITELLACAEAAEAREKNLIEAVQMVTDRAENAEAQRDAAIKELDEVAAAVDDFSDFLDEEVHPVVDYNLYLSLRENADAISMWQYEEEWRGKKEE